MKRVGALKITFRCTTQEKKERFLIGKLTVITCFLLARPVDPIGDGAFCRSGVSIRAVLVYCTDKKRRKVNQYVCYF